VKANKPLVKHMIDPQEIESFLHGNDPEEFIVAIEFDYVSNSIFKIKEIPGKGKEIRKDTFIPFAWVGDLRGLNFYNNSKMAQKEAMTKYGIVIDKLETKGDERLEKGLTFMVKSLKGYRELIQFFRDGGCDPWGEKTKDKVMVLPPVEQYLVSKEKRLFKGYTDYDDVTRLVFDLETNALDPKDGRIFMIGIKTNKGFHRVIECLDESQEKGAIIEFFNVIDQIKPSIIGGYNSANFDWHWLFERGQRLGIDMRKSIKSLHPQHSYTRKESILKLANEVEDYTQTSIWGYNVIDIIHAVRRAQAINSNIKAAGLKYITTFIGKEAKDRVYIDHGHIGKMYEKKEEYWLNIQNGNYRKVGQDTKIDTICESRSDIYLKTTGDNLVERYLDDDLEETLAVDKEFNQASFLLASMIPTTYERVSTMGTATLWKMLMLAWSYKHGLAIPAKQDKTDFVGGLSRLLKVGYSKNVLKLDFSSLYPSIQLVHDVFPQCDVTGAMKGMLKYFRDTRIKYKQLAEEYYNTDPALSSSYSNKQLPIKIFINSMFGALSAPQVYAWGDMYMGEQITCTGRQYLRQMIKFFMSKGYTPLVMDTDGVNFSSPDGVENHRYVGRGLNWKVKAGKEYTGPDADVAEYNDIFMRGEMALDTDGVWPSCINLARKNYAVMDAKGKIKLTGNSIKSKKLPLYIEEFLDKGIKLLLNGDGKNFIEYYYEYLKKIFDQQIPLSKIAQRAKVKLTLDDYKKRLTQKTKAGNSMSRMAHMELAIQEGLNVNLGDVIMYVNNGKKASQGDVQKMTAKQIKETNEYNLNINPNYKPISDGVIVNCYMLDSNILETNPEMTGEYNVPRAIATFNKRIEPLLVVFQQEVRDNLIVTDPESRGIFTNAQCELINGMPFEEGDQDKLDEDVLQITEQELSYWEKRGLSPNYIYDLAEEGWEQKLGLFQSV
jgi:DNA polymerase elongation subunit (family B)